MAKVKQLYTVRESGFFLGSYHAAGETIELYAEQARFDLPPHGTGLELVVAASAATPEKPARARKSGE